MFHFGSEEDQAAVYWQAALGKLGPKLPEAHLDDLSLGDIRHALAYARMAYEAALNDGAPSGTLDILLERHDALFGYLASVDDDFKGRVLGTRPGRKPVWLGGYDPDNIAKYQRLASAN